MTPLSLALGAAALLVSQAASALVVDFEGTPSLAIAPDSFIAAGPMQTLAIGPVTISGGVVLGQPQELPAQVLASLPNVYGTARYEFATSNMGGSVKDVLDTLQSSVQLDLDAAADFHGVSGLLLNGVPVETGYAVEAFAGGVLVAQQSFDIAASTDADAATRFSVWSPTAIDQVVVRSTSAGTSLVTWSFFVDDLHFSNAPSALVPEPATTALAVLAGLGLLARTRRQRRACGR